MIRWISGKQQSGKTHLATALQRTYPNIIVLDGWALRQVWEADWSKDGRVKHNHQLAKLAKYLERQGYEVVVTSVCPYEELRKDLKAQYGVEFVYVGEQTEDPAYEKVI